MTFLPETLRFRWRTLEPLMQSGAILTRSIEDGLYHAAGGPGGGLNDRAVEALEHRGYIRRIGVAYVAGPWAPVLPTPLDDEAYPAITVWQPWAALIAEQVKPWEFRGYRPPKKHIGRRIAIHAAVRPVQQREMRLLLLRLQLGRASEYCLEAGRALPLVDYVQRHPASVSRGLVVCTAVLGEPLPNAELRALLGGRAVDPGQPAGGWAWPLTKIERLAMPAPARGKQGWWWWRPREGQV